MAVARRGSKSLALAIFVSFCVDFLATMTPPPGHSLGAPWPLPHTYQTSAVANTVDGYTFQFQVSGNDCADLRAALNRYYNLIFYKTRQVRKDKSDTTLRFQPRSKLHSKELQTLEVNVHTPCETYPHPTMDESYSLNVSNGQASLVSKTNWGALRGLETLSQIIYESPDGTFQVNNTVIQDAPRFPHRGIHLDTSRHYLTKEALKKTLEAMSYNKFNVFHWHIVDRNSFPYQSVTFPKLSDMGAYDPHTHIYSQEDVKDIIEFARLRGIRVIAEFDSPGHCDSWGKGQPGLLTKCCKGGKFNGKYGPIDPTLTTSYDFLKKLMAELSQVFPDNYMHLGGDEVHFSCWQSNPNVTKFMQQMKFGSDYSKLEQYYMQQLTDILGALNKSYMVWQEVADNGVKVRPDTLVEIWKGGQASKELAKVTGLGYYAVLSSCWYLNRISYGGDWQKRYLCDPHNFKGTAAQKARVMGGEACMWGEYVDSTNVISRLWPRASAVAERLWSPSTVTDVNAASPRFKEHRCRMIRRGINAEPQTGPGYCPYEYRPR